MTLEVRPDKPEGEFLRRLSSSAKIAAMLGAAGSTGLLLHAAQRTPRLLLILMASWVLSPFTALVWANLVSKQWSSLNRVTLYALTLAVVVGSLVIYGDDAQGHRWAQAAFVFVLVPGASWLLMAIAVPIVIFISGRRSGPGGGERSRRSP
jgi:hypothetical protein